MADPEPIRRLPPKRIIQIDLPGEWAGFWVRAWVNADWSRRQRLAAPQGDDLLAIFGELILDHNLTDFDGNPLPPAGTNEFFERMPADAFNLIRQEVLGQFGKLSPTSAGTSSST